MAANLTQIATDLISHAGYGGLSLGLFVDSLGLPIPSEVLIPLATILATRGRFAIWAIFVIGTLTQVAGALVGYLIGRYGGEPILERYGKYILISHRDLQRTHRAFQHHGRWLALLGRCIPGVRGLIAYPAGIAEMRLSLFLLFTTLGAAIWTAALMWLGFAIGRNTALMDRVAAQSSLIGLGLVLAFVVWHFRHLWWRRGRAGEGQR